MLCASQTLLGLRKCLLPRMLFPPSLHSPAHHPSRPRSNTVSSFQTLKSFPDPFCPPSPHPPEQESSLPSLNSQSIFLALFLGHFTPHPWCFSFVYGGPISVSTRCHSRWRQNPCRIHTAPGTGDCGWKPLSVQPHDRVWTAKSHSFSPSPSPLPHSFIRPPQPNWFNSTLWDSAMKHNMDPHAPRATQLIQGPEKNGNAG